MLNFQILLILLTLVGLLVYFYRMFFRQVVPTTTDKLLDKTDKRWMLGLSLVYALISFIHFADTRGYTNPWHGNKADDQIILTLPTPTPLSEFYYSTGYIKGKYTISAFSDTQQAIPLIDNSAKLGYPPYFRWNKINFDGQTKIAKIILHIDQGPVDITQFALTDKNGGIFSDYRVDGNTPQAIVLNDFASTTMPVHMDNNWQSSTVFDEIFYATSAYQYLHGIAPDVWVHPQLSIYFIIIGILIFGMSPLGWRIMPDLASILIVPLMYMFAKRVFKDRRLAIAASILMMSEFMHYTMGRMASIDPFATLFLTLEYYFLYTYVEARMNGVTFAATFKSLLLCAISFSLAFSCKWIALYSVPAILLSLIYCELICNRHSLRQFGVILLNLSLLFIMLPLLIYLIIYIPLVLINNSDNLFQLVYQTQLNILDFHLHGSIHSTHPYASKWWSWPLNRMPLSVYYWQDSKGYMSTSLALLGNPALYWLTWPTIIILAACWVYDRKNYIAGFLFLAIVAQYLPYAFVARISFIYYFYSVTPFLIMGICYFLNKLLQSKNKIFNYTAYIYIAISVALFIEFFSALSGIEVPRGYTVHALWWSKNWNF